MFSYLSVNGIDKFTFYRMPKILFTDDKFQKLSCESKVLYGLLLDRATLSKSNNWIDENGRVYVYYRQDEAMEMLGIRKNKIIVIFKELEEIGLIIRRKIGQGNPTKIYVMNFSEDYKDDETNNADYSQTSDKSSEKEVKRFEKQTSEIQTSRNSNEREVKKFKKQTSKGLKNKPIASDYINNTERNENISINPSTQALKQTSEPSSNISERMIDEIDYQEVSEEIKSQILYERLLAEGKEQSTLDLIVYLIADVYCHKNKSLYVNGVEVPIDRVEKEYAKIEYEHISYIFECIDDASSKHEIKNIRNYLQTCLFNAPHTMDFYYENQANFDLNNRFRKQ